MNAHRHEENSWSNFAAASPGRTPRSKSHWNAFVTAGRLRRGGWVTRSPHYSRRPKPCLWRRPCPERIAKGRTVVQSRWAPVRRISMPLDVHSLQSFYGSPLGAIARQADRAGLARALGQRRRPVRRRRGLRNAISRPIPRRRQAMPGLDAGGTGRRHLAGRRAVLGGAGGGANAAAAGRLDRSSAPGPCSGGGRPAGRAARGTVARHRAGGTNPGRSLPPAAASGRARTARLTAKASLIRSRSSAISCIAPSSRRSSGAKRFTRRRSRGRS